MSQPAQWFRNEINDGLARLMVLHLPSSPWEEEAKYTQKTWTEVLWGAPIGWDAELDTNRLRVAFARLARDSNRWPLPRQLLQSLPARPERPRLGRPKMSEAQKARNRQKLAEMVKELGIKSRRHDGNARR
ncbi:hypothetical protein QO259_10315 [Salinicola sp. JS01]|uniref:hypothetical protein n=1 Tax=Salinicola sp. JS01 TaxID=3050071 RepID=UPI00255B76E3|nr:hypothetical protein [Salinicola sp. JS01]WIX31228.1 hypothetical protein QO259_10315 [Salinicola sp. JS01]